MLIDQYGREMKRDRPLLDEIGVMGVRDAYSSYPSQGLTPERLARIFKEADSGDIARQAELFEEMEEKDAHIGSVLQTRKLAVAGLEWEVVPASDDKRDAAIAAFIKEAVLGIANFDEAVVDLLDAVGKGFSASEIMWAIEGGRVVVRELKWRHQKRFAFIPQGGASPAPTLNPPSTPLKLRGEWGVTDAPRLLTDPSPVHGVELPPNKFVFHRYKARSGASQRGGVLRPCAYMYLFKNYTLKDWVIFAERFAMPMRVGKFSASASEADRRVLRNAVFNLGSDAAAVISDSTVIDILESGTKGMSSDIYERLCEFCDRSVSKAVLGQTLTTDQTQGTYATARVHQTVRQDILEADAKALAKTISTQIIRPLVEFNFGMDVRPPLFKFHHEAGEDLKTLAETYGVLARELGFKGIPESYIRKRFGIPHEGPQALSLKSEGGKQ